MSNKKSQQDSPTNSDSETEDKQGGGFLSLEAKAGLSLICILICGFSFMVWQQWKHQETEQLAGKGKQATEEEEAPTLKPNSSPQEPSNPTNSKVAKSGSLDKEPFADQTEPPVKNATPPANVVSVSESEFDDNPFAASGSIDEPQKANIPTLEVPEETPTSIAARSTKNEPSKSEQKTDPFDPFGEDIIADQDSSKKTEKPATTLPSDEASPFDPFGPELKVTEDENAKPEKVVEFPSLDESSPEKTSPENTVSNAERSPSEADDPFAAGVDPFAERPAQEINEPSKTALNGEMKPPELGSSEPEKEAPNPLSDPPKAVPAIIPQQGTGESPVADAESYQDPLPILEPVPTGKAHNPTKDPFGEFQSVPAGSAQASSITSVAPEFPDTKPRKGTLAELDASSKSMQQSDPLMMADDPFAEPAVTAKRKSKPFHLQEDGTYQIQSGDSYWNISRKAYGTPLYYRALAEFNSKTIPNPQNMTEGARIQIPPTAELERRYPKLTAAKPTPALSNILKTSAEEKQSFFNDESGAPMYRIQKNDTLTGIAQKYLGRASRWIQIYELNRQSLPDPNKLKIGTLLKLPRDASRVKIVGE